MALAYHIVRFYERYGVDKYGRSVKLDANHQWPKGVQPRKSPYDFLRYAVRGDALDSGWRHLLKFAGDRADAVNGIFIRLGGIAASQSYPNHGWLLGEAGLIHDASTLAWATGFPADHISHALSILTHSDLRWFEHVEYEPQRYAPPDVQDAKAETPEGPPIAGLTLPAVEDDAAWAEAYAHMAGVVAKAEPNAAYRGLTVAWRDGMRKHGDPAFWMTVTAEDFSKGRKWGAGEGLHWGPGTLRLYMQRPQTGDTEDKTAGYWAGQQAAMAKGGKR